MTSNIGLFEHFRLLLSLTGKEDRGSFWPYAALVLGILFACNFLAMIPFVMAIGHPFDAATGDLAIPNFALYFGIMFGLGILLYGAAMVRRLRDAGRSPLWALMPLPFIGFSTVGMSMMFRSPFDGIPPDMQLFQWLFISNGLYMLTLIALIVLLAMPSAAEPHDQPE